MSSSISFQINGRAFSLPKPHSIIEAADQLGIYIPRFCYHKKLSVVANCRMCLVEVEGMPKPVPACATAIMPNMHILTRSTKTKAAQQAVMEFLLINHPLDCPICDQGGQCELQDLAMRYGRDESEFNESKRSVTDPDLGSLVATEMTRCIQCTRCVRFGAEVSGQMELGAVDRGEETKITTYVERPLQSELSGNMIDVCPVGALTSKPFQFKARAWELRSLPSIAPHDCLGSQVNLHVYDEQVVRVVPREEESINEVWLSDRDRYGYLGIHSKERLTHPMIKVDDKWETTDWETALEKALQLLKSVSEKVGADQIGGLIAPHATLEELYLFQKLCRALGTPHIDHRLKVVDTRDQDYLPTLPISELPIQNIEQCDVVWLIGSNIQREQPLLITRLRRVVENGGSIVSINCVDYAFSFDVSEKVIVRPDQLNDALSKLVHGSEKIVEALCAAKNPAILVGALVSNHPEAAILRYWIGQLAQKVNAKVMVLTEGPNTTGAWIAGVLPHRAVAGQSLPAEQVGLSAQAMLHQKRKAYLLFNVEPALDCANPSMTEEAMQDAESVIVCSAFTSPSLLANATVLLPTQCFAENEGTFVNIEGKWQSFQSAIPSVGESKPGWEVLASLLRKVNESDHYASVGEVQEQIKSMQEAVERKVKQATFTPSPDDLSLAMRTAELKDYEFIRITEWAMYSVDPLVRRAEALQKAGSSEANGVYIHSSCAARLSLQTDDLVRVRQNQMTSEPLTLKIEDRVPEGCLWIPSGRAEVAMLGASFGVIEVIR